MPVPGVAHGGDDPIAAAAPTVVVTSIRPAVPGRRDRVLGVHDHVQEHLVQQQRIALDARQLLVIVSHDFDVQRTAGVGARSASTFCSTAFRLTERRASRRDPAKTSRLRTIFAARSASR